MILAYVIIALIVLALLLRRDLSLIGRLPYRGGQKFIIGVIGLFVLQAGMAIYPPGQTILQMIILNLSQIALVFLVWLNRHLPGAKLFALGIVLNVLVMIINGGWMPVTPETYHFVHPEDSAVEQSRPNNSKNIILPRSETNLWILSDIIPISLPWRRAAMSLGDVLLVAGVAWFIFRVTARKENKQFISQV